MQQPRDCPLLPIKGCIKEAKGLATSSTKRGRRESLFAILKGEKEQKETDYFCLLGIREIAESEEAKKKGLSLSFFLRKKEKDRLLL